jgi:Polyketide cyclase / dehydrase and lipid transport
MATTWGTSTELDDAPTRVWDFIVSETNDMSWRAPWLRAVRRLSSGPVGVGTQYESDYRFFGRDETVIVELTELDPPKRMAWRQVGRGSLAINDGSYDLEPFNTGTRFTVTGTIASPGVRRLFDGPFCRYLNRAARQQHRQLAAALRQAANGASASRSEIDDPAS